MAALDEEAEKWKLVEEYIMFYILSSPTAPYSVISLLVILTKSSTCWKQM